MFVYDIFLSIWLLYRHGIARVVAGMVDPDVRVSGKGLEVLKESGIVVDVGVCEVECRKTNKAFVHRILKNR